MDRKRAARPAPVVDQFEGIMNSAKSGESIHRRTLLIKSDSGISMEDCWASAQSVPFFQQAFTLTSGPWIERTSSSQQSTLCAPLQPIRTCHMCVPLAALMKIPPRYPSRALATPQLASNKCNYSTAKIKPGPPIWQHN